MHSHAVSAPAKFSAIPRLPVKALGGRFRQLGEFATFVVKTFLLLPVTLRRYRGETLRQMNSLAWGRGSLLLDGGVVSVLLILGVALGASLAIEAYSVLNIVGFESLSGIVGGVGAVRVLGPLVGGIAFAVQTGCRMTAEIGSMRIAEEIDALEAMALRPIPFVVGTRMIGGLISVIPGYIVTLVTIFYVMDVVISTFHGVPGGTYDHYFIEFVTPRDLLYSTIKVAIYCIAVTLVHCYYGFFVTGGPAGVGRASGRAVRGSLVIIMTLDFFTTVALWGIQPVFVFTG